jgi:hypothetical protein
MTRWIVPLLAALLVFGTAYAGNDKGQVQLQVQGKGPVPGQPGDYDDKGKNKDKSTGQDASNRGQVTSECNHRANDKNLKGQERKDYVEWCQSRGARYGYRDDDYKRERGCYQSVFDKMLGGEKRQSYLDECLREAERKYEGGKSKDKK